MRCAPVKQETLFVLSGRRVSGIITGADLQRPPISLVALGLILGAEDAATRLIASQIPEWETLLSSGRLATAREVMGSRKLHNAEIDLLQCITLEDRLGIVKKQGTHLACLGFESKKAFKRWVKDLREIRDVLAHSGSMLDARPDPQLAAEALVSIRTFADAMWRCARASNGAGLPS